MNGLDPVALDRRLQRVLAANRYARDVACDARNRSPWLAPLQRWQVQRLSASFAGFLADPRTRPAAEFFLEDLYGDHDVSARDRGLERILPLMRRLLPAQLIETAADAIELAWLTHAFDLRMAEQLERMAARPGRLNVALYGRAYRALGKPRLRRYQIELVLRVGGSLDRAVHKPWVARLLHASRLPAKVAGLNQLQAFLERGFAAFAALDGAKDFLAEIERREHESLRRLFAGHPAPFAL